jgi:aminoglycoside phosphotransferase (APT) family kinase protein
MALLVTGTRMDDAELARRLERLVAAESRVTDVRCENLQRLGGGNARHAYALEMVWSADDEQRQASCVLLCRSEAGQLEANEAGEFAALRAVWAAQVAQVPQPLWLDAEGRTLGMPGIVLARLPGRGGGVAELLKPGAPHTRGLMLQLAGEVAALHAIDWSRHQPPSPVPDNAEQHLHAEVGKWERRFVEVRMEPLPALAYIFSWLRRNLRAPPALTWVHGDCRPGNFLHLEGRITGLLDWELSHWGDPLEDLAWAYRPLWSPEAFLPMAEFVQAYQQAAGAPVDTSRLAWNRVFAEAKHSVISLTGARAYFDGHTQNLRHASRTSMIPACVRAALRWIDELEHDGKDR